MIAGFKVEGMKELEKSLEKANKEKDFHAKKFMVTEGNNLRKATRTEALSKIQKITGNYLRHIKRETPKKSGKDWTVKVKNDAKHGHLIEYGHEIVMPVTHYDTGRKSRAFHIVSDAAAKYSSEFYNHAEDYLSSLFK